jgi:pyrroloquinoline quinone biosynthesis protein B
MTNTPRVSGVTQSLLIGQISVLLILFPFVASYGQESGADNPGQDSYLVVLGIAQDAGFPQAGCRKNCCRDAWNSLTKRRSPASLAIVDSASRQRWLLECTPQFRDQLRLLGNAAPTKTLGLDGVFLTHAHIGHYAGLIQLGREVMGTKRVPVYAMPRMKQFLQGNGPWSQLVTLGNIDIRELADARPVRLNQHLTVTPFLVPHRDEFSETVGFRIQGPNRSAIFLPDIDKWERWNTNIEDILRTVDVAYLDGTFFADGELPGRDMSKIPHPFVAETIERLAKLPARERAKVRFLHFNHTNPVLDPQSDAAEAVRAAGHRLAVEGERFDL